MFPMKNIILVCKARNQHTLSETTISPEIQAASAASAYPGARAETRGAWGYMVDFWGVALIGVATARKESG